MITHDLKINPGGEVRGVAMPDGCPEEHMHRLLDLEEATAVGELRWW